MLSPKDVLVVTTSNIENSRILKYFKPVSAHVVAGTNVFSDFAASFSDFFGGRSGSYQNQLTSLYSDAIERIKVAAFELGANCVIGLSVDIDEISGKGKSMFMITAVGTAVRVEYKEQPLPELRSAAKVENVSLEKIKTLKKKQAILKKSEQAFWNVDETDWQFITSNSTHEVFPALYKKYSSLGQSEDEANFYKKFLNYLSSFSDETKKELILPLFLRETDQNAINILLVLVRDLDLLDLSFIHSTLVHDDFFNKKKAIQMLPYEKPFYNSADMEELLQIKQLIMGAFPEKGTRSIKKGSLLSKEKEVWTCPCGSTNDVESSGDSFCYKCGSDIQGFKSNEVTTKKAIAFVDYKMSLIAQLIK